MGHDFFEGSKDSYHVSSYFYSIEFQQRGAPHVYSLLWLKNKSKDDAPNYWFEPDQSCQSSEKSDQMKFEEM